MALNNSTKMQRSERAQEHTNIFVLWEFCRLRCKIISRLRLTDDRKEYSYEILEGDLAYTISRPERNQASFRAAMLQQ